MCPFAGRGDFKLAASGSPTLHPPACSGSCAPSLNFVPLTYYFRRLSPVRDFLLCACFFRNVTRQMHPSPRGALYSLFCRSTHVQYRLHLHYFLCDFNRRFKHLVLYIRYMRILVLYPLRIL